MEEFSFPFPAYDIQISLMKEIYQCIEERKVGIFESPTGTGKSLSTICSVLTWLERFETSEKTRLQEECKIQTEDYNVVGQEDWIAAYRKKFNAKKKASESEEKLEMVRKIEEKLRDLGKNVKTRKRVFVDDKETCKDVNEEEEQEEEFVLPDSYSSDNESEQTEQSELSCLKIFYASRTHSQLEQFTNEIFKTRFRPRMVTIGSRQTLCLNSGVRALKSSYLINEKCNELRNNRSGVKIIKSSDSAHKRNCANRCAYYKSEAIEELGNKILTVQTPTVSKVTDYGKKICGCPYFASRKAVSLCQLVLLPYQVLLHKETRKAWGISLKGNVVVIDEAHNLLQTIASIHSTVLTRSSVSVVHSLLKDYIERYRSRLAPKNLLYLRQLLSLATALNCLISIYAKKESDTVFHLESFLVELNSSEIDFFKLLRYMDKTCLCKKLHGFFLWRWRNSLKIRHDPAEGLTGIEKVLQKKKIISETEPERGFNTNEEFQAKALSPIYSMKQFIESLTTKWKDARIIFERETVDRQASFKFILLNPADKLADVVKEARSLVLVGGTMEPAGYLFHSLNKVCEVSKEKIVKFTCSHVIDDSQLLALSLGTGKAPSGLELTLNFTNRLQPSVLNGIAMTLLNLLRFVVNGAVAFFPSYEYMHKFEMYLKSSNIFAKINNVKPIVLETKYGSEDTWNSFIKKARSSSGAVLFAVVGGKLSEGINFSDDLGRCVFMVGLPYPNKNDIELGERMKYLDMTLGYGSGSEMYEAICLHAINQAVGRVIRHRNDYAAIVLIDSRFCRDAVIQGLPGWIRTRLTHCDTFGKAISSLSEFFKQRASSKQFKCPMTIT